MPRARRRLLRGGAVRRRSRPSLRRAPDAPPPPAPRRPVRGRRRLLRVRRARARLLAGRGAGRRRRMAALPAMLRLGLRKRGGSGAAARAGASGGEGGAPQGGEPPRRRGSAPPVRGVAPGGGRAGPPSGGGRGLARADGLRGAGAMRRVRRRGPRSHEISPGAGRSAGGVVRRDHAGVSPEGDGASPRPEQGAGRDAADAGGVRGALLAPRIGEHPRGNGVLALRGAGNGRRMAVGAWSRAGLGSAARAGGRSVGLSAGLRRAATWRSGWRGQRFGRQAMQAHSRPCAARGARGNRRRVRLSEPARRAAAGRACAHVHTRNGRANLDA